VKKAIAVLSFLALSVLSLGASAASKGGTATSPDGRQTTITRAAGPAQAAPPMSKEDAMLSVLYDNFNSDPNNAYNCCVGWTISGPTSPVGATFADAMPFTPASNATVKKIVVAVGYVVGVNGAQVSLNADAGGLPGAVIKKFKISNLPTFGTCCAVESKKVNVPVTGGTQYWIVVQTNKKTSSTWDAWNWNNTAPGNETFAFYSNGSWALTSGSLGAFKVLGN